MRKFAIILIAAEWAVAAGLVSAQSATDVEERYRQKADIIEQALNSMTPSERAQLFSINDPKEGAKKILDRAAEVSAGNTDQVAVAPKGAPAKAAPQSPASQPDSFLLSPRPLLASAPATQPGQGSQVSFFLTRNLPEHLRAQHHLLWQQASAEQRQEWREQYHSILKDSSGRLEDFVAHKNQFDRMPAEVKERYRQKAGLIEQVLNGLTPSERAGLLSIKDPKERAKRILDLAAELKAKQAREGVTPPGQNK